MVWIHGGSFTIGVVVAAVATTRRASRRKATSSSSRSTTASARSDGWTSAAHGGANGARSPTAGCSTRRSRCSGCAITSPRTAAIRPTSPCSANRRVAVRSCTSSRRPPGAVCSTARSCRAVRPGARCRPTRPRPSPQAVLEELGLERARRRRSQAVSSDADRRRAGAREPDASSASRGCCRSIPRSTPRRLPTTPLDALRAGDSARRRPRCSASPPTRCGSSSTARRSRPIACTRAPGATSRSTTPRRPRCVDAYRALLPTRATPTEPIDVWAAILTDREMLVPAVAALDAHAAAGGRTFGYRFDWPAPPRADGLELRACHGVDIPFTFATFAVDGWDAFVGADTDPHGAHALSAALRASWCAFARTGDPAHEGVGAWPRYTAARPRHDAARPPLRCRARSGGGAARPRSRPRASRRLDPYVPVPGDRPGRARRGRGRTRAAARRRARRAAGDDRDRAHARDPHPAHRRARRRRWARVTRSRSRRMRAHAPRADIDDAIAVARAADADLLIGYGGSSVTDATKIVALRLVETGARARVAQIHVPTTLSSGEWTPGAGMTGDVPGREDLRRRSAHGAVRHRARPRGHAADADRALALDRREGARPRVRDVVGAALASVHRHARAGGAAPHPPFAARDRASARPTSLEPRRLDCQLAGWMSMAGIVNVRVHLSHTLGHQIAARWDVGHGITSCITLPPVLRFMASEHPDGVRRVADAFDIPTSDRPIEQRRDRDRGRDRRVRRRGSGFPTGCATSARAATTSRPSPTRRSPPGRRPATCRPAEPTRCSSCSTRCGERAFWAARARPWRPCRPTSGGGRRRRSRAARASAPCRCRARARCAVSSASDERRRARRAARRSSTPARRTPGRASRPRRTTRPTGGSRPRSSTNGGRDVLAAADDEVGRAAAHAQHAVGVAGRIDGDDVAGAHPAVGRDERGVRLGVVPVAEAGDRAAARGDAGPARRGDVGAGVGIEEPHVHRRQRVAGGVQAHVVVVARASCATARRSRSSRRTAAPARRCAPRTRRRGRAAPSRRR